MHALTALCPRLEGLQITVETSTGASRLIVAVCEVPRVAVTIAPWLLTMLADAVALNVPVVAPEVTVTDAGTVSSALALESVTLDPPAGAASVSVTVQVLTAPCPRLIGLQVTPDTASPVSRLMLAVCELLPRLPVMVALWLLAMVADAAALKVAVVAPDVTVTDV